MVPNRDFAHIVKSSEVGKILLPEQFYIYDNSAVVITDDTGNKIPDPAYLCSAIILVRRYTGGKVSITSLPLSKNYNGEPINKSVYSNNKWIIKSYFINQLSKMKVSTEWRDFKNE